jgi:chromosome segregation ATPase
MKRKNRIPFVVAIVLIGILMIPALSQQNAQERAANLRSQLADVHAKEAALQTRLQQLEENLKPENIEHSLAGVGSTRPEELREQRRRQLEIERNGVRAQLDQLAVSRARLQDAIARADADAYRESAGVTPSTPLPNIQQTNHAATVRRHGRRATKSKVKVKRNRRATHKPIPSQQ